MILTAHYFLRKQLRIKKRKKERYANSFSKIIHTAAGARHYVPQPDIPFSAGTFAEASSSILL